MYPPRLSVFFNVASFFGYGMVIILFILLNYSNIDIKITTKLIIAIICCLLIIFGFLSFALYHNHKEKKWKIFEQWKNSWLARERMLAILNFFPVIVFFITWIVHDNSKLLNLSIIFAGLLSLLTIFCSAMIYESIKTIHMWNNSLIPSINILNSLISGGIMLFCILFIFEKYNYFLFNFLIFIIPITLFLKMLYLFSTRNYSINSSKTNINLEKNNKNIFLGKNHFNIATEKKNFMESKTIQHFIAIILMYILPLYTLWNTPKLYINKEVSEIIYILTLLFFTAGMLIKRKLFFTEIKHLIDLHYGNKKV